MGERITVTSQELRRTGELLLREYTDAKKEYFEVLEQIGSLSSELSAKGVELLKKDLVTEKEEADADFEELGEQILKLTEIADSYDAAERGNVDAVPGH